MTKVEKLLEWVVNPLLIGAVTSCGFVIGLEAGTLLGAFLVATSVVTGYLYQQAFIGDFYDRSFHSTEHNPATVSISDGKTRVDSGSTDFGGFSSP